MTINVNKFVMFTGASYIPLPKKLARKNLVVNVKNNDEKCFLWSILAALHPRKTNVTNVEKYKKYEHELNTDGITFPMALCDIQKFEEINENISVNVYAIEEEYNFETKKAEQIIVPVRLTESVKAKHIHLLILHRLNDENDEDGEPESSTLECLINNYKAKFHYCWVSNLCGLIQAQVSKTNRNKKYICDRCLHYFHSNEKLLNHLTFCKSLNDCKVTLPSDENKWIAFKNYNYKLPAPFIVYADIESLLIDKSDSENLPKGAYEQHVPFSVAYYFKSRCPKLISYYKAYTSEVDCMEWFANELLVIAKDIWKAFHETLPMKLSKREKRAFKKATICHICEQPFDLNESEVKVRDHDHYTGAFRGAAHNKCNLKYQEMKLLTVVFHNLSYDQHLLLEKLASEFEGRVDIIPKNGENYLSFTKVVPKCELTDNGDDGDDGNDDDDDEENYRENLRIRFIDSYKFLPSSLAKIADTMPKNLSKSQNKSGII